MKKKIALFLVLALLGGMIVGKLVGGAAAVALALLLTKKESGVSY